MVWRRAGRVHLEDHVGQIAVGIGNQVVCVVVRIFVAQIVICAACHGRVAGRPHDEVLRWGRCGEGVIDAVRRLLVLVFCIQRHFHAATLVAQLAGQYIACAEIFIVRRTPVGILRIAVVELKLTVTRGGPPVNVNLFDAGHVHAGNLTQVRQAQRVVLRVRVQRGVKANGNTGIGGNASAHFNAAHIRKQAGRDRFAGLWALQHDVFGYRKFNPTGARRHLVVRQGVAIGIYRGNA